MKKLLILLAFISTTNFSTINAQEVNGSIYFENSDLTVVKVHGTHQERGYAVGYLLAEKIKDMYENYLMPAFGSYLSTAKLILSTNNHIAIDSAYIYEAMSMMQGITDAGVSMTGVDYVDLLVANCFLDLENLSAKKLGLSNGCSSLMTWGDATLGTPEEGKTIISRHMDWSDDAAIIRNQVIVVHFPTEADEQPWLLIGFAGQISVLSGLNNSGLTIMQHMLADNYASGQLLKGYEPIWFTLRKAIEKKDFNNDDVNDVQDVKDAVLSNLNGYADSYIVTALAPATSGHDTLIAAVAELTPDAPYFSLRNNKYPDSIPGDNLYAANWAISRNNAMHFCMRYDAVRNNMGDGTGIGAVENWRIMKEYSSSCGFGGTGNIQFMQYVPEDKILRLALHNSEGTQACENDSLVFNTNDLFTLSTNVSEKQNEKALYIHPNPATGKVFVYISNQYINSSRITIHSIKGEKFNEIPVTSPKTDINNLKPGIYTISLIHKGDLIAGEKIIVK
ncbi:MAG: T9SS type A sorting domain-containing protein [Bacteroidales bacterium]|nr:T9SS type A sorting domain-containing protein [Bacteroidales bacterium]